MADTTLGADCALSKRDDETSQQHADRLLAAHQAAALKARMEGGPLLNRPAFDRLERGACDLEYVKALTHSAMDIAQTTKGLSARPCGLQHKPRQAVQTELAL